MWVDKSLFAKIIYSIIYRANQMFDYANKMKSVFTNVKAEPCVRNLDIVSAAELFFNLKSTLIQ